MQFRRTHEMKNKSLWIFCGKQALIYEILILHLIFVGPPSVNIGLKYVSTSKKVTLLFYTN